MKIEVEEPAGVTRVTLDEGILSGLLIPCFG